MHLSPTASRTLVRRPAVALVALALAAGACSDSDGDPTVERATATPTTAATATTAAPATTTTTSPATAAATTPGIEVGPGATAVPVDLAGGDVYEPPEPLPPGEPGDLLATQPFPGPDGSQGYQVLYRSETAEGDPVAVSGVVVVPAGPAPVGGRPVLSWANGTVGLGDACAESKRLPEGQGSLALLAPFALSRGWVFAATDYEGIGTPGVHPYLVGASEGRNVLDMARAAQRLPDTGASAESPVLVWGHSQGGHAAAFAAELQPTYAPELDVVGAALGAPAGELPTLLGEVRGGPFFGFGLMILAGFHAAYPDAALDAVLTPAGIAALDDVADDCVATVLATYADADADTYVKAAPGRTEPWAELLETSTPGVQGTPVPVWLYHGEDDTLVPPFVSQRLLERYCAAGGAAERRTYPGTDHTSVIPAALGDLAAWFEARLAGSPPPNSC